MHANVSFHILSHLAAQWRNIHFSCVHLRSFATVCRRQIYIAASSLHHHLGTLADEPVSFYPAVYICYIVQDTAYIAFSKALPSWLSQGLFIWPAMHPCNCLCLH